jgi:nucleoid-associated protein YgaU
MRAPLAAPQPAPPRPKAGEAAKPAPPRAPAPAPPAAAKPKPVPAPAAAVVAKPKPKLAAAEAAAAAVTLVPAAPLAGPSAAALATFGTVLNQVFGRAESCTQQALTAAALEHGMRFDEIVECIGHFEETNKVMASGDNIHRI